MYNRKENQVFGFSEKEYHGSLFFRLNSGDYYERKERYM